MQPKRVDRKRLITHRFKPHEVFDAYDTLAGAATMKAIKMTFPANFRQPNNRDWRQDVRDG